MLNWLEERLRLKNFLTLPMVPRGRARWQYFPGFMTFVLLILLLLTGLILALAYDPAAAASGKSGPAIYLRNCHHLSAQLLIAAILLYFLRNLLAGAYQKPGELNWLALMVLFALIFFNFCLGSLLPADSSSQKTIPVFIYFLENIPWLGSGLISYMKIREGLNVVALQRLFTLHCVLMTIGIYSLLILYFWLAERSSPISEEKKD